MCIRTESGIDFSDNSRYFSSHCLPDAGSVITVTTGPAFSVSARHKKTWRASPPGFVFTLSFRIMRPDVVVVRRASWLMQVRQTAPALTQPPVPQHHRSPSPPPCLSRKKPFARRSDSVHSPKLQRREHTIRHSPPH